MLRITSSFWLEISAIRFTFVRSPGPGGQNVNKLATAAVLRLNANALPEAVRARLRLRLTVDGDIIIKASRFRTQERNRQDALDRLTELLKAAAIPPKKRHQTKPTKGSIKRRLDKKKQLGKRKLLRSKPTDL